MKFKFTNMYRLRSIKYSGIVTRETARNILDDVDELLNVELVTDIMYFIWFASNDDAEIMA